MNKWNQESFIKAWHFATEKHTGQTYGGHVEGTKIDYLNHVGLVAMEVTWCLTNATKKYDADLMTQCAILHDTIEDTDTTYDEIKLVFGYDVAEGVMALTKNKALGDKPAQMRDSLARILKLPSEVATVKIADRITNLYLPPFYWDKDKIAYYINEAMVILNTLTNADPLLLVRLEQKIASYRRFLK